MQKPAITIRGTRHPNAHEAIQHLSVSGDDHAILVGGMYLSVEKAEAERAEAWPQAAALWRRAAECLPKHPCARLAADRDQYLANAAACDRRDRTDAALDKIANNVLRVPTLRRFGDPPAHLELTPAKLRMMLRLAYEAGREDAT